MGSSRTSENRGGQGHCQEPGWAPGLTAHRREKAFWSEGTALDLDGQLMLMRTFAEIPQSGPIKWDVLLYVIDVLFK